MKFKQYLVHKLGSTWGLRVAISRRDRGFYTAIRFIIDDAELCTIKNDPMWTLVEIRSTCDEDHMS